MSRVRALSLTELRLFLREPVTVLFTLALPLMVLYVLNGVFAPTFGPGFEPLEAGRAEAPSSGELRLFEPSTAPSTVIAGVIIPSPYSSAAPKMPISTSTGKREPFPGRDGSSAVSARMPPSPWLSARMTIAMYLTEMTRSSE